MKDLFKGINYDIIDLNKSKSNLIPKKVPIRQENGKVTYGIRWVNPNKDVGSEEGGGVSSEEEIPPSIQDIMDNNTPVAENAVNHEDTAPSVDQISVKDMDTLDYSLHASGVIWDTRLEGYVQDFRNQSHMFVDGDFVDYTMEQVCNIAYNHVGEIKSILLDDISNMNDPDIFVQAVQREMIKNGKIEQSDFTLLGSNPKILKQSLVMMLGKTKYNALSKSLKNSNITINTPPENLSSILDEGYRGQSIEDAFIKLADSEDEVNRYLKTFDELMSNSESDGEMLDLMLDLGSDDSIWYDVHERVLAEYDNMCLSPEDRRPCYLAYNASGDSSGPTTYYGEGVVEVNDTILNHCTVSKDDSFNTDECIPKIYGKDHLQDLYLLKMCELRSNQMSAPVDDILGSDWKVEFTEDADLPLEIQYHQSVIHPDNIKLINEGY